MFDIFTMADLEYIITSKRQLRVLVLNRQSFEQEEIPKDATAFIIGAEKRSYTLKKRMTSLKQTKILRRAMSMFPLLSMDMMIW